MHGFMCKTDFDHHLFNDVKGTRIYPSVEALRADRGCIDECGIVKVEIKQTELVLEGTL